MHIGSVIPCHNRRELTLSCVEKLLKIPKQGFDHTIYVVDDGSIDGTGSALKNIYGNQVIVLTGTGHLFWTGAVNMGIRKAIEDGCDGIHLMNDDIEFKPEFLQMLYNEYLKHNEAIIGSVVCSSTERSKVVRGGVLLSKDKKNPWFEIRDKDITGEYFRNTYAVDAVSGRSVLISVKWFDRIGYFDQKHFPHSFADFDFFFRVRKMGGKIFCNPYSIVYTEIEPKFVQRIVKPSRLKATFDLWFDQKYFGISTDWHKSKFARYRSYFLLYTFLQKTKWTLYIFICSKNKLSFELDKSRK
jgi:GT2 family glycosyltransferase